jgi:hypothetical protein
MGCGGSRDAFDKQKEICEDNLKQLSTAMKGLNDLKESNFDFNDQIAVDNEPKCVKVKEVTMKCYLEIEKLGHLLDSETEKNSKLYDTRLSDMNFLKNKAKGIIDEFTSQNSYSSKSIKLGN